MKKKNFIIIIFLLFLNNNIFANENKILFKVNNQIITTLDIRNEINYLNSVNENFKNLKEEKIYQIAKDTLIKEKIKEIFLLRNYRTVNLKNEDFDKLILENYSSLGINNKLELRVYLRKFDLTDIDLKKKITINTFWSQYIYTKHFESININVDEIKKEILQNDKQKELLMSEILFNLENGENLEKKFSLIKKNIDENGFENSALVYSISETAKNGGEIGWVKESSINSKVLNNISKLKINEYSQPIVVPGGFLILKIKEIKEIKRDINLQKELDTIIRAKTNNQLNQYSNIFLNKIKKEVVINEL